MAFDFLNNNPFQKTGLSSPAEELLRGKDNNAYNSNKSNDNSKNNSSIPNNSTNAKKNANSSSSTTTISNNNKSDVNSCPVNEKNNNNMTPVEETQTLSGGVTCEVHADTYYFITKYGGEELTIENERNNNKCQCKEHKEYTVEYIDKDSGQVKKEKKPIANKDIKLYYYNIFHRAGEWAKAGAKEGWKADEDGSIAGALLEGTGGLVAGEAADYIMAIIDFGLLPIISANNNKYYYYTKLIYNTCEHDTVVPLITIVSYPDIEFSIKFEWSSSKTEFKREYDKTTQSNQWGETKKKETDWGVSVKIKYNDETKKLSLKQLAESSKEKGKNDNIFKKILDFFDLIKDICETAQTIKKATGDAGGVTKLIQKTSKAAEFELTFEPSIELKWKYAVSDDLKKIGRDVSLALSLMVKGELTIDIVVLAIKGLKKLAVATAGATFGLSVLIVELLEILVAFAKMIAEKRDGFDFYFDAVISIKGTGQIKGDYNTTKEHPFSGSNVSLKLEPEFEIKAGLEFKTTMIMEIKVEMSAGVKISAKYELYLEFAKSSPALKHKASIEPLTLYAKFKVLVSYGIFSYDKEKEVKKEFGGKDFGPWPIYPKEQKSVAGAGAGAGGGGGGGW